MIHNFISFLLKFALFYDLSQTRRQMLKEFREDLQMDKSMQNPVTINTYESLPEIDKIIINRFKDHYRVIDNAIYLSRELGYSYDGINRRVKRIAKQLCHNIGFNSESV